MISYVVEEPTHKNDLNVSNKMEATIITSR